MAGPTEWARRAEVSQRRADRLRAHRPRTRRGWLDVVGVLGLLTLIASVVFVVLVATGDLRL